MKFHLQHMDGKNVCEDLKENLVTVDVNVCCKFFRKTLRKLAKSESVLRCGKADRKKHPPKHRLERQMG